MVWHELWGCAKDAVLCSLFDIAGIIRYKSDTLTCISGHTLIGQKVGLGLLKQILLMLLNINAKKLVVFPSCFV